MQQVLLEEQDKSSGSVCVNSRAFISEPSEGCALAEVVFHVHRCLFSAGPSSSGERSNCNMPALGLCIVFHCLSELVKETALHF